MGEFKRTLVTAALPYTNGPVHIGHLSGAYLPADIYVRYLRARKKDVLFVCGSDEHGVAITIKAKKEGLTPQQLVDKYHQIIKDSFAEMNIQFDIYHRTSDPIHHETAANFFRKFYDEGKLIEKTSLQYFDPEANMFLADRYITGTCPKCNYDKAYGDQCEKCGSTLSPADLINPKSALSKAVPVMKETKHWFLPLDQYQESIEKYILNNHTDWKTNVLGQCKSWLKDGLQPRAITRDLEWGIPVPVKGAEGKVLYVWFDAPIGYISATKAWAIQQNKPEDWKTWWQNKETRLIQFIGKDNIVFHCIIFPSMLMAHGDYIVPDNVPANEFLNLEGDKISTSRNWAVWVHEYLQDFPGKADILRYVLCATLPETKDNDFTWKDFQTRHDSELADILGNFLNRVMVMTHKNFDGKVQKLENLTEIDLQAIRDAQEAAKSVGEAIEAFRFRDALFEMMRIARIGNKYLMETEPWKVLKTDKTRTGVILSVGAHLSAMISIAIAPFMPDTSQLIAQQLNFDIPAWDSLWNDVLLAEGHLLGEAFILFQKIPDEQISAQIGKLEATKIQPVSITPQKAEIEYPDFEKLDLRIGTIKEAQAVPKANKLLQLTVDTGIDVRTIVSGIAEHFKPEELIEKQVVVVVNLKPRPLRGIVSQGMILTAETPEGKLILVSPIDLISSGSIVK